jgi:eukaryotic-like serine/threonine-protein kinase
MTFRERFDWILRMGILVFILAATAFLSAVTAMRFAIQGREVNLPNLVGKSSADAQAILQGRGLHLKVVDRIYSDMPPNAVVRQSPPAGEKMKVSQDTHVVLSLGPQNVTIPPLAGETQRIARVQLLQAGLQLGEISGITSPDLPEDAVIQQDPPSGAKATSPRVNLLVNLTQPKPAYIMPWLVGMQVAEAERLITSAGLKFTKITYAPNAQWPKGAVIDENPDWGSRVTSDTSIEIVVTQ